MVACQQDPRPERTKTLVFAAASLTEVFRELERVFEGRHPDVDVELHFAGTPRLVLQLREGAPADVLAAADDVNMQRVEALGVTHGAAATFAQNRLVIVTPPGNPRGVRAVGDLAKLSRVLLCGPEVPAGRYARKMLTKAGVAVASASDEPSVRSVVSKVRLGEADAGVVYATDAQGAGARVAAVAIPANDNVVARYPIAVLRSGGNRVGGAAFVAFVRSSAGREILKRFGFEAP